MGVANMNAETWTDRQFAKEIDMGEACVQEQLAPALRFQRRTVGAVEEVCNLGIHPAYRA